MNDHRLKTHDNMPFHHIVIGLEDIFGTSMIKSRCLPRPRSRAHKIKYLCGVEVLTKSAVEFDALVVPTF